MDSPYLSYRPDLGSDLSNARADLGQEERVLLLRRANRRMASDARSAPASVLVGMLCLFLASGHLRDLHPGALGSLALMVVLGVVRWRWIEAFDRRYPPDPDRWRRGFALILSSTTFVWSFACAWVIATTGLDPAGILGLLLWGVAISQAVFRYSQDSKLLGLILTIAGTLPLVGLAIVGSGTAAWAILAMVGALAQAWAMGRAIHGHRWRSLIESYLLEVRAAELAEAKQVLQVNRDELEAEVHERAAAYRRVAGELARREQDYRSIFENAHDAILVFAPENERVLNVNARACELYGYPREEFIGLSLISISEAPDNKRRHVLRALSSGEQVRFETRQRRKDGKEILLDINASVIVYGGRTAILSINRDITDRDKERKLRLAVETAERANRLKSEFLANMSHEIRTPMAGIIGLSDLLFHGELAARERGYAESIRSSAESLLEVIDDILDFSKIEADKLELDRSSFELRDLMSRLIDLVRPRAAGKGVELVLSFDDRLPGRWIGAPSRLRQVLLNLVGNAVKFTEEGEVELAADLDEDVGDPSSAESLRVRFSVRDTGIGIDASALDTLFDPFTQADGSMARRFEGSGLGLAICKRLVEMMDGRIEVQSQPGAGSIFWFVLRLEVADGDEESEGLAEGAGSSAQGAVPPRQRRPLAAASDSRILVAEDNPVNRLVITEQLSMLGYRADAVHDGVAALAALESERYDLVLMDCQMPGIDGYEATRRIRQAESEEEPGSQQRLPIIALTAHAMKGDREKCLAAGMDDYVAKPFTEERLVSVLEQWLGFAAEGREEPTAPSVS